jgi:hypothetical protein
MPRLLAALATLALLAGAASAADPAPAAAAATAPETDPNLVYALTSKSATFNPEKGTLTLKGLVDSVVAIATTPTGQESFARREASALFGKKGRTPAFDAGAEVVVEGKKGLPAGHKLILMVSSPKLDGSTLTFEKAAVMTGNFTAGGLAADAAARHGEGALITDAEAATAPVTLDDAVTVAHVVRPRMGAALEAHTAKAAKDPAKGKADKAAAAPAAPAADAAAPAKPAAPAAPAADAPSPTTATPTRRRSLLQDQNCGVCEYANNAGACVTVGPDDCDGVVGQSGEWNCGTCQFFTQDDFEGHCEVAPNC